MNILQCTGMPYPTKYGSYEKWLIELGKQANMSGDTVYVAYKENVLGVEIYSHEAQACGIKMVVLEDDSRIAEFCIENKIAVVHYHFDFQEHSKLYWSINKTGIKQFATLHCECGYYVNRSWEKTIRGRIRIVGHRIKTKFRERYFSKIFAVSEIVRKQYVRFYGFSPQQVQTVYLGIQREENKKEATNDIPIIVCTAFHSPVKGIDILLEALKLLKDRGVKAHCLQIGGGSAELNGEDTQALKQKCEGLGIKDTVEWIGVTNRVQSYLEKADIYCQPSRSEAISLSIAEAMQCKLPIVASNVGGVSELVKDGVNGFLVEAENPSDLADKLERLITNSAQRKRFGKNSLDVLETLNFYQDQSVATILKNYHE